MSNSKTCPAFKLIGTKDIKSLDVTVSLYEHIVTGAMHFHMASDNTENMFMVMFRTMPKTSNGVAHILEHTALCGSKHYPTRDPFFSMIKRSINSFMNAFTSCDWTAYPFASPNKKDFWNLMDVYLDSAFFPNLDELDFRQEGHRLDFAEPGNKASPLVFKGVVFNEMKGAMSPPECVLSQAIQTALCPGTTYEINSGGEPVNIPELSHQGLQDFHKTHYHPTNSVFITFGNIPAVEHQQKFEDNVLSHFTEKDTVYTVPDVKRFNAPKHEHIKYAFDEADTSKRTFVKMGWLLGQSNNTYERFKAMFLQMILLGDSSAPLMAVLESSDLGTGPLGGVDDSNKEISFLAGLRGSEVAHAEAVEDLILSTLKKVAKKGIPAKRIEALLDQMEYSIRNQESGGYPLGLAITFNLFPAATHGGDLLNALDLDPVLAKLRKEAAKPDFIRNIIDEMLLNNPHRVTIVAEPDTMLSQKQKDEEASTLAKIKSAISDEEMDRIVAQAKALDKRQSAKDDVSCLPTVTMADIPLNKSYPTPKNVSGAVVYEAGTNGIVAEKIVVDMPQLTERQLQLLPLYTAIVTEIGVGKRSYLEVGEWQSAICNGFGASYSIRNAVGNTDAVNAFITFSANGLERRSEDMVDMMVETINDVSFAEHNRIKDIIGQIKPGMESSATNNGHTAAISAATHNMSAAGDISFKAKGLEGVRFIKELDTCIADDKKLASLAGELTAIHVLVKASPRQVMSVAEAAKVGAVATKLATDVGNLPVDSSLKGFIADKASNTPVNDMWVMNTQINYCVKAYKAVVSDHPDAAALHVLTGYLRNNFIHTAIREKGGAYGGMVVYNPENGTFAFASYRDPRISGTLADYDAAVEWMLNHTPEEGLVHEAIFGLISKIDAPNTPIADAAEHFSNSLHGRTDAIRSDYRKRILAVTAADLVRVAKTYLNPEKASVAVITSEAGLKAEGDLGMNVIKV